RAHVLICGGEIGLAGGGVGALGLRHLANRDAVFREVRQRLGPRPGRSLVGRRWKRSLIGRGRSKAQRRLFVGVVVVRNHTRRIAVTYLRVGLGGRVDVALAL